MEKQNRRELAWLPAVFSISEPVQSAVSGVDLLNGAAYWLTTVSLEFTQVFCRGVCE